MTTVREETTVTTNAGRPDVRRPWEYVFVGHAPMAVNIPLAFLAYAWDDEK